MLKKEVKRMEWGIPEVQPDQRAEAKYLLGITDDGDALDGGKGVKVDDPKGDTKEEEKEEEKEVEEPKEEEDEEDEEEDEEEVEGKVTETKKK